MHFYFLLCSRLVLLSTICDWFLFFILYIFELCQKCIVYQCADLLESILNIKLWKIISVIFNNLFYSYFWFLILGLFRNETKLLFEDYSTLN